MQAIVVVIFSTNKVYLSRHLIFYERTFSKKEHATSHLPSKISALSDSPFSITISLPSTSCGVSFSSYDTASVTSRAIPTPESSPFTSTLPLSSTLNSTPPQVDDSDSSPLPNYSISPLQTSISIPVATDIDPSSHVPASHPMTTRLRTGSLHPKTFQDYKLYTTRYPITAFHTTLHEIEPTCFTKAFADPWWKDAMSNEYPALTSTATWTLWPQTPHHNVIHNKWVYKIK